MAENRWNLPNLLAAFRLVGSFVAVGLAMWNATTAFAWLVLALLISDWIDGKLAILLNQRTTFGARLDSTADSAMYGAMLFGAIWLESAFVRRQWAWFAAALGSYALTTAAGLSKYHRVPSYHTRAAKTSWLLVGIAAFTVFAQGPVWPFRVAMAVVVVTNLEALAMTLILPDWHADIPSLFHAWQLRQGRWPVTSLPLSDDGLDQERKQTEHDQTQDELP